MQQWLSHSILEAMEVSTESTTAMLRERPQEALSR